MKRLLIFLIIACFIGFVVFVFQSAQEQSIYDYDVGIIDDVIRETTVTPEGGWGQKQKKKDRITVDVISAIEAVEQGRDFAEWKPSVSICRYARAYIEIKKRRGITVDGREEALLSAVTECGK